MKVELLSLQPEIYNNLTNIFRSQFRSEESEYKAYQAFLELVTEDEAITFFEKGHVIVGDWVLYSDLEIGPKKNLKKDREVRMRRVLSCTDGGSYELPYFDRLIQKYLFLKHNPQRVIDIGKRHLKDVENRKHYIEDDMMTITFRYNDIKKSGKIKLIPGQTLKITGMPDLSYSILKKFHPIYNMYKRHDIVYIKEKKDIHSVNSLVRVQAGKKVIKQFRRFFWNGIIEGCKNFKIKTPKTEVLDEVLDLAEKHYSAFYDIPDLKKSTTLLLRNKKLKRASALPFNFYMVVGLSILEMNNVSPFTVIEFYEKHPEYQNEVLK